MDHVLKFAQINFDPKIVAKLGKMEEVDSLVSKFQAALMTHGPSNNYSASMYNSSPEIA